MFRFKVPGPIDDDLAAIDSPEAVADRRKRALRWAEELEGDARGFQFLRAGWHARERITRPLRYGGSPMPPTESERAAAEAEAGRIADAEMVKMCEIDLRARDLQAVYNNPDRMEQERVWNDYIRGVSAIAWSKGNQEDKFASGFRDLLVARNNAVEFDDDAAVRSAEAKLMRLVGIEFPVLPDAAWAVADLLSAGERQAEYDRLEAKYGPRHPSAAVAKTRAVRRETRSGRPQLSIRKGA